MSETKTTLRERNTNPQNIAEENNKKGNTFCFLHRGSCSKTRDVQKAGKSTDEKDRERSAGRERS